MLEAELGELDPRGNSPLAAHISACARCGAVAVRVMRDTYALAAMTLRTPRVRQVVRRAWVTPFAALGATMTLAALVLMVLRTPPTRDVRPSTQTRAASPATGARVRPSTAVAEGATREPHRAPAVRAGMGRRSVARAYPPARRISPTSFTASVLPLPSVTHAASVVVHATLGQRTAILRTPDPSITVVWIY
jgi:hypothetical protein